MVRCLPARVAGSVSQSGLLYLPARMIRSYKELARLHSAKSAQGLGRFRILLLHMADEL